MRLGPAQPQLLSPRTGITVLLLPAGVDEGPGTWPTSRGLLSAGLGVHTPGFQPCGGLLHLSCRVLPTG